MVGQRWLQNFTQIGLEHHYSDKCLREIPYPYPELAVHATFKTCQLGSFFGGWILPWTLHYFDKTTTLKTKMKLYGRYGLLIGLAAGPIVTLGRVLYSKIDKEAAKERCYRLRYNKRQLFMDRITLVAGGWGYYGSAWLGLINSVNILLCFTVLYNTLFWDVLPRAFHDYLEQPPPPPKRQKPDL